MNFLRKSVGNLTQNSMTITKHLLSKPEFKEKNALISPLSLQTVLSIIAAGTEGPTQRQLLSFLGSESITNLNTLSSQLVSSLLRDASPFGGPSLTFANSIWVEKSLSIYPSFKQMVTTDYMASLESHDFINEGLIRQVISPPIDSLTRLMFANALYFKGAWDHQPFHPSKTKQYDFYLLNDSSVKVPFMASNKNQFVGAFDGFKVLRLPYERGVDQRQFSMYLFLPDAKDGLLTLIEKMASDSEFLEHNLPNERVEVGDFRIPKFEISFGLEASDALKELGVVLPFCPSAGVTKMVDTPNSPTWVSDILQKSFIKVNEEGTEAAAVTFSRFFGCARRSSKPVPIDFVADHPFLFMIREDLSVTKKQTAETVKTVKEKTTPKAVETTGEPSKARKRPTNVPSTETGPSKKPKPSMIVVSDEEEEEEEESFQRKRRQPPANIETNIPETTSDSLSTEEKERKMKEKKEKKERKEKRKEEKKKEGKKSSEDRTREKKNKKSKFSSDPSATNLKTPSISSEQQEPTPEAEVQEDVAMLDATLNDSDNMPQQNITPEDIISNKSSGDTLKDSETTISEKIIPELSQDQPEHPNSAETDNKTSPFKEWNETAANDVDANETSSEEEDFDSEAMKEAEAGGSELLPETSTSKLSASLGLPEEEFISLQIHDPEAALKLLISKTTTDPVSSSGPSNSTASDSEINSSVRQDSLISKLYTDFINGDILASVEEHPANAFKHKSFLNKLHNPQTDLETLGKVIQLESILDQFATTVQSLKRNSQKLVGQQVAYDALFEKAMAAQSKVDQMKAQVQQPGLGIQECTNNISKWEAEIDSLRAEIADREKKILEEKAKRSKIEEAVAATTQESIREAAKEGISHFSAATVIKEEIKSLEDAIKIQTVEVGLIKDHYADFKSKCLS
ncbi:unnamed protein product [Trifolium pratense]|uniref:Uncharacterized protein n=1 Tax=Trifolium pratense TaxID=57577 RepID=A0ACB0J8Y8_TRIPR|nr:unnamed protein product [Trifolium pratense]